MFMCVSALDSAKDHAEYEKDMQGLTKMVLEGRNGGAKRFFVPGDLNIELGFLCMDEEDEMKDISEPQYWYGIDAVPGVLKKSRWLEIKKEFKCTAVSTWLSCDDRRAKFFTHNAWGKNGRLSQLVYILCPRTYTENTYIINEVKLCSTWDHYRVYTAMQDAEGQVQKTKKKRRREGWRPTGEKGVAKLKMRCKSCKNNTSKDPFSRCETCKNLVFSLRR